MPVTDDSRPNRTDLPEALTRNRTARQFTEGLAGQLPADIWRSLTAAFSDTPALAAEITELRTELASVRLDRANLAAAALATIAAHHDGEPDPLSYLRDELRAQGYPSYRSRP
jgi:hypothetical protein